MSIDHVAPNKALTLPRLGLHEGCCYYFLRGKICPKYIRFKSITPCRHSNSFMPLNIWETFLSLTQSTNNLADLLSLDTYRANEVMDNVKCCAPWRGKPTRKLHPLPSLVWSTSEPCLSRKENREKSIHLHHNKWGDVILMTSDLTDPRSG